MTKTRPFLGTTTNREEALSSIISLDLKIRQDKFGYHTTRPGRGEHHFTKENLIPHLACINPRCQQGGLDLQQIAHFWSSGTETFPCNGHEGSPKGRRKGEACDNYFEVTLSVERK